jgi:hypothetical protein
MSGVCGHQTLGMIRLLTSLSQWCVRYSTLLWVHRSGTRVPRPVSRAGSLRPTSGCARIVAASGNPRYLVCGPVPAVTLTHTRHTLSPSLSLSLSKADNILRVELDMPNRTTRDYECPSVAPSLRAALSRAMAEEEEMTVDAGPFTLSQKPRLPRTKTRLRQSSESAATPTTHFPTRRGLVTPSV